MQSGIKVEMGQSLERTDNQLETALKNAERGKNIIDAHTREDAINQIFVIFPDDDSKLLESAYRYLPRLIQEADYLTIFSSIALRDIKTDTSNTCEIVNLGKNDMNCILRFAAMAQIDVPSIKIVSMRFPKSQRGELLPGYKDISMDVVVVRGLYGIFGEYA